MQVFGQVCPPGAIVSNLPPQDIQVLGAGQVYGVHTAGFRMRRIRVGGVQRTRNVRDVPSRPLTRQEIESNQGELRTPSFSVIVNALTTEGYLQFPMDIGQTIDVLCASSEVRVIGPEGSILVPGANQDQIPSLTGIVADAVIGTSSSCIESASGTHSRVVYSTQVRIPLGQSVAIPVPTSARTVKAEILYGGTAISPWIISADDPLTVETGRLYFDPGGTVSTEESKDVGRGAFLFTDTALVDRVVGLVWEIEP